MAGLIELIFVYSVALAFGIWQLVSVRRQIRRDKEVQRDQNLVDSLRSEDPSGHAER